MCYLKSEVRINIQGQFRNQLKGFGKRKKSGQLRLMEAVVKIKVAEWCLITNQPITNTTVSLCL
ncbi:Hypothetical predicted protein [Podarcis lilfordi]|uniref:Uncharacterized protein n=1 Tax=Podarcis lilfordi TaxID=74358 RepID=A0AA35KH32_9SAUR|nr:Hypothetical predicted protein [Podarcis lilfordi]